MSTSTATIVSAPSTDAQAAATVMLPIKWDHYGELRRFSIPVIAGGDVYIALMEKIHALRPDFQGGLAWNDEEGDLILLSSAEELKEAMALTKDGQLLKVFSAGDFEKEGEDEVVVIDDEEEEEESGDEPVVQFMPRRLRRERGHHDRSRSRSARSDRSRSRSASCDFSSDESNGCRKMKKLMAKSCKKGCTKGCTKGYKKEAKKMMKMMRRHSAPPPFAMRCSGMTKKFAHHPFHPRMEKKCGQRHGFHKRMMMMRMMAHPEPHPFFEGRRHPWMPHGHRHPPPPPMMPEEPHVPCMRRRSRSMPPVDHSDGFPMDHCEMMDGFERKGGRGMGCRGMGRRGMAMAAMGHRGMGHRGMGMGHRGMGMDHRGMGMGHRGMGMGHRGMGMGMGHGGMGTGMGHRGMGMDHRGIGMCHRGMGMGMGMGHRGMCHHGMEMC